MTVLPQAPPVPAMTVADYLALGQDNDGPRTELQEGAIIMVPGPTLRHNASYLRLGGSLDRQAPPELRVVPDVDIDLRLVPEDGPATVRRPDMVVVTAEEYERVLRDGGVLRASGALLVVEIISPSSRRTDRVVKRDEYADAGIPHYWIIDLRPPVSLIDCRLDGGSYVDGSAATGVFETREPFPVTVDLDALV